MIGVETMSESAQAVAIVGAVLVEAIALYLVYGVLSTTIGSSVIDALGGD